MLIVRIVEILVVTDSHYIAHPIKVFLEGLKNDFQFSLIVYIILFVLVNNRKWFNGFLLFIISLLTVFHLISAFYLTISLIPIDHTIYQFTLDELWVIIRTFGKFEWYYLLLIIPFILVYLFYKLLNGNKSIAGRIYLFIPLFILASDLLFPSDPDSGLTHHISLNKTLYFCSDSRDYLIDSRAKDAKVFDLNKEFPLLHNKMAKNTLGPFFKLEKKPPNFVFIIVESLSSSYSGKESSISFTPFLDSLAEESIYFPSFLSTTERTFGVLPSSMASLPNGEKGFTAMGHHMPNHTSLPKILFENGYQGAFYYGGNASFDDMNIFMEFNGFDHIFDYGEFQDKGVGVTDKKFSVDDKELFENAVPTWSKLLDSKPFIHVYLTSTMHYPFAFKDQEKYADIAKEIVETNTENGTEAEKFNKYLDVFSSSLYTDDAIKDLLADYKKKPEYENTIFLIYGDHAFGRTPKRDHLDKYRVPLIIYSPLLKRTKEIKAVNSHLDIAPSILALLDEAYEEFDYKNEVAWLGEVFDTSATFRNLREINFMLNSRDVNEHLSNGYFISHNTLYQIAEGFEISPVENDNILKQLYNKRDSMQSIQEAAVMQNKILPEESELVLLTKKRFENKKFSEKEDYIMLLDHEIQNDQKQISVNVEMQIVEKEINNKNSNGPLLIFTIRSGSDSSDYWSSQKYQKIKVPVDSMATDTFKVNINQIIRSSSELSIHKRDRFKIYWWNQFDADNHYVIKNATIVLEGDSL